MNASPASGPSETTPRLVLASSSPRRQQLLNDAGYRFDVLPPREAAESVTPASLPPAELVATLATRKATDVLEQLSAKRPGGEVIVVAADTIAECNGELLGKPAHLADARRMLRLLSGRLHRVLTGVCVVRVKLENVSFQQLPLMTSVDITTLRMDTLSDAHVEEYLQSAGWRGKAGAFGYQDRLGWVHIIEGSESNVVGLPLDRLAEMLRAVGAPVPPD